MVGTKLWKRWATGTVGSLVLVASSACALSVIAKERLALGRAFELGAGTVLAIAALMSFAHVQRTYEFTFLLARLGVAERFRDGFLLTGAGFLLNHLPFNVGFFARGVALKRHLALDYAAYASLTLVSGLVNLGTAAFAAALSLAVGIGSPSAAVWLVPCLVAIGALSFGVLALPRVLLSSGTSRGALFLRALANGLLTIRSQGGNLAVLVLLATSKIASVAVRLALCFHAFGLSPSPTALVALAAANALLSLANLTPGNLGLRELMLGVLSTRFGIPPALGLAAAALDRAVLLAYTALVGIPGVLVLRERLRAPVGVFERGPLA